MVLIVRQWNSLVNNIQRFDKVGHCAIVGLHERRAAKVDRQQWKNGCSIRANHCFVIQYMHCGVCCVINNSRPVYMPRLLFLMHILLFVRRMHTEVVDWSLPFLFLSVRVAR